MNKGFSLVEVIVSAVIFTLSLAGVFAAVGSFTKQPVAQSSENVTAALYGQKILDSLRNEVSSTRWSTGRLTTGSHTVDPDAAFSSYNAVYTVEELNGVRKVTLNITTP